MKEDVCVDTGGENVYFHIRDIDRENVQSLRHGQTVKYTIGQNTKGICAQNIVPTGIMIVEIKDYVVLPPGQDNLLSSVSTVTMTHDR